MITDRNKLNFVTIQWLLWFFGLILLCSGNGSGSGNSNALIHNVESTHQQLQQQQQQQQQHQTLPQLSAQQQQPQSKQQQQQHVESNGPPQQDVTVRNFSPRMDYNNNEWRPVGRGDPLKNDPTFDYSPPTLDRVRYWADPDKEKEKLDDVSAAVLDAKIKKANPGKNEILLLGVTGDRMRGAPVLQHAQHTPTSMMKNAKGETPLLQPKYTSIRRSYYAHQLPTHLMPPPMQPMMPASQQQQPQQPQQQQQQNMVHMMKPAQTEYRHNMPGGMSGHSYMSSPLMAHSKPHHMSSTTQAWMHSPSASASMATSMPSHHMKPMSMSQHYSHHPQDAHHQESVHYMTYTRPNMMSSTPAVMSGHHEYYSPNSIRGGAGVMQKTPASSRKPWLHDLLKKEIIKPQKPTMSPNYYHTEAPKPPQMETHFEPMLPPKGISTTYAPVSFVTPTTTPATTPAAIYVTSSSTTYHTTTAPIYTQAPTTPHTTARTTTTLSPTRLLIPNTSNLAYRPTVTPMKMTTDSLFSHYNQPEKPLKGPMYLIIEGHSKVKTYGKDELDPHRPKIVPVISKREPVVRRGDPNEKRGTPETFQVKHLHTKTTQPMEKPTATTPIPKTTTTTKKPMVTSTVKPNNAVKTTVKTTKATKPTTATKPTAPAKPTAPPKTTPAAKKAQPAAVATTAKPVNTTKPVPKLSLTTSSTTTATTAKPKIEKIPPKEEKIPSKESKSPMKVDKLSPNNVNALDTAAKPSQVILNQPPTGMQGLLSLLGSSLDSLLRDDANNAPTPDGTTKLKPVNMNSQPQIESRVSTKLQAIKAEDYYDDDDATDQLMLATTEYLPRETRQIFDYDQMPESRISEDKDATNYQDIIEHIDDEEDLSALGLDDEYEDEVEEDGEEEEPLSNHQLIKRIDAIVSSTEDLDEDFDDDDGDDMEALDLARQQNRSTKKA